MWLTREDRIVRRRILFLIFAPMPWALWAGLATYVVCCAIAGFALPNHIVWAPYEGWDACPRCGYDLEGISEALCPECGLATPSRHRV